jgi:hypothetical protein
MDPIHHLFRQVISTRSIPEPNSGCWLWLGSVGREGYGEIVLQPHRIGAHRAAFAAFRGTVAPGAFVCHRCDNPSCVNPDHLFVGSHADNMRDAQRKGRLRSGLSPAVHFRRRKLTDEQVAAIRADQRIARVIAADHGVGRHHVYHIKHGRRRPAIAAAEAG